MHVTPSTTKAISSQIQVKRSNCISMLAKPLWLVFPTKQSEKTLSTKIKGEIFNSDSLSCTSFISLITGGGEQFCDSSRFSYTSMDLFKSCTQHVPVTLPVILQSYLYKPEDHGLKKSMFISGSEQDRCLIKLVYVGFRTTLLKNHTYKHTYYICKHT